jgi:hypothetical protein
MGAHDRPEYAQSKLRSCLVSQGESLIFPSSLIVSSRVFLVFGGCIYCDRHATKGKDVASSWRCQKAGFLTVKRWSNNRGGVTKSGPLFQLQRFKGGLQQAFGLPCASREAGLIIASTRRRGLDRGRYFRLFQISIILASDKSWPVSLPVRIAVSRALLQSPFKANASTMIGYSSDLPS